MQSYNRPEESAEYYLDYGPWAGFFKGGPVGEAWARKMAAEKGAAVADKTAVRQDTPVKKPVTTPSLYFEKPTDRIPLPKEEPLIPNNAPVKEELLRRFFKRYTDYNDVAKPNLKTLTPWNLIELQIKAREDKLKPTEEELSI